MIKLILLFLIFFFVACGGKNDLLNDKEVSGFNMPLKYKQDIRILPKFKPSLQKIDAQKYKNYFFYTWRTQFKNVKAKNVFWSFDNYLNPKKKYYFYNKQVIPKSFFKKVIANANANDLLKLKQKALVVKTSHLKNLPTDKAILLNPYKQGEGFPFDYALDSVLNVGTPVLISHLSKDKHYAFVRAESGWGFVESSSLQKFTDERANTYQKLNFITPLEERMPVYDIDGQFAFETRIGAIYPYYDFKEGFYLSKIGDTKYKIPSDKFAKFPIKFNDENLKNQMTQLINLPYGWGGYNFERDCSLLTRDLFAPFGVYLPRNSYAQSVFWQRFDISALNNEQKLKFIKNYAKPYETLLYLKGHIMLYTGLIKDENVAFHSIWGIRTEEDGRLLVAKSSITTLDIGKNISKVKEEDLILTRLQAISFLYLDEKSKAKLEEALSKY